MTPSSPALTLLSSLINNKDSFTGKEVWLNTDTKTEQLEKGVTYVLRQLLPSITPGLGYSANKIQALIQNRPDLNGYVRKAGQVLIDVLGGIKITPIDPTIEAQKRAYEKKRQIEDLRAELRRVLLDKTLTPQEKQKESGKIQEKMK